MTPIFSLSRNTHNISLLPTEDNNITHNLIATMIVFVIALLVTTAHFAFVVSSSSPLSDGPWGPTDPVADPAAVVKTGNVRFTILTDRLIRMERATAKEEEEEEEEVFEDRKTVAVINRKLPVPNFQQYLDSSGSILTIITEYLTLTYHVGQPFAADTLWVEGQFSKNNKNNKKTWTYRYGDQDPLNLLGTIRTLDGKGVTSLNCSLREESDHCEPGLISRSGYAVINDTLNWALDDEHDWWAEPNQDEEDLYLLGHGIEYKDALADYVKIGGRIPLLPRYAFGVWFSRWYDYTPASAAAVVDRYEQHSIPLDVFVLDMVSESAKSLLPQKCEIRIVEFMISFCFF
jgi:alpha-glucosidase